MPTRIIAFASFLVAGFCLAEDSDETKAATAHQESIIFSTVASSIFGDIGQTQITDAQILEWLDEVVHSLAVCQIEALDHLDADIRDGVMEALASGADRKTVFQVYSKDLESDPGTIDYINAHIRCRSTLYQHYGVDYLGH